MQPKGSISYRKVLASDIDFLRHLYGTTRNYETEMLDWSEQQKVDFLYQQFRAQHDYYLQTYPLAEYLVILKDDTPIGRIYLDHRDSEIRLMDISLIPEERNNGLGSSLMKEVLEQAKDQGKAVRIHVERFNPALKLYERLGFRLVEDRNMYFFMEWTA